MEKELPTVRIGHLRIVDHLLLGYSLARIRRDGPPLVHSIPQAVPMNSWDQVCDALRRDRIQAALLTTPLALELFGSGLDIRYLMFAHRSGSLMVRNRAARITGISGFKGKSVLIPAEQSVQAMLFHKFLATAGLDLGPKAQVSWETAAPALMPEMLETDEDGDIGGYMVSEPFASLAVSRNRADRYCTSDSLWKDHPCCGLVVKAELVDQSPRVVDEMVRHLFESAGRLEGGTDALPVACEFLDQDRSVVQTALGESGISFTPEKLLPDIGLIRQIQTYMRETMGILPNPADLDAFVDNRWAMKAVSGTTIEN